MAMNYAARIGAAAKLYRDELENRHVLFIPANGTAPMETYYPPENFKHLCGVNHPLNALDFYMAALDGTLNNRNLEIKYRKNTNAKMEVLSQVALMPAKASGMRDHPWVMEGIDVDGSVCAYPAAVGYVDDEDLGLVPRTLLFLHAQLNLDGILAIARTPQYSHIYDEWCKGGEPNKGKRKVDLIQSSLKSYDGARINVSIIRKSI